MLNFTVSIIDLWAARGQSGSRYQVVDRPNGTLGSPGAPTQASAGEKSVGSSWRDLLRQHVYGRESERFSPLKRGPRGRGGGWSVTSHFQLRSNCFRPKYRGQAPSTASRGGLEGLGRGGGRLALPTQSVSLPSPGLVEVIREASSANVWWEDCFLKAICCLFRSFEC